MFFDVRMHMYMCVCVRVRSLSDEGYSVLFYVYVFILRLCNGRCVHGGCVCTLGNHTSNYSGAF